MFSLSSLRSLVSKRILALAALPLLAGYSAQPSLAQTTEPAKKAEHRPEQQTPQDTKTTRSKIRGAVRAKNEPRQRKEYTRREATRTVIREPSLSVIAPRDRTVGSARYRYFLSLPGNEEGSMVTISVDGDPCRQDANRSRPDPVNGTGGTTEARAYNTICLTAWRDYVGRLENVSFPGKAETMVFSLPRGTGSMSDDDWTNFLRLPHVASIRSPKGVRNVRLERVSFIDVDQDGDGISAMRWGGLDCDDNDADRWPGNSEIADAEGHDEDCDFRTIGKLDLDGDGFIDARIWNRRDDGGRPIYGDDCDDRNRGVNPGVPEIPGNGIDDNCDGDIDQHSSWRD